ncbi:MAG: basic amino acid ABC transporter substrate-binding protein [Lachnospiraceae bacterium]|nr:basic amino acid ABC transporter substrate-binding protein [Lachnospiraceae bacterium]
MKKKIFAVTVAMAMATMMLSGCGSSSQSKASEAVPSEAPASEAASTEAAAPDAGEATGETLIVGTNAAFPPFEYVGDDGQPDGFDVALIKAIGEKIGANVEIQDMEFDSLVSSIGNKIDMAIAGMTVTEERKNMVDFSEPYYEAVQSVIIPKDAAISSAEDLKGAAIGTQLGTTGNFLAEDIEGASVSTYNKGVDAVNDLINGRVDCVIIDKNPAEVFGAQFADKLTVLPGSQFDFEVENYAIALPKGNTELADKVNAALADLKADGTYDKLVSEYIDGATEK